MSSSKSNASNAPQSPKNTFNATNISPDASPRHNKASRIDRSDRENEGLSFEKGPTSPARSGRLSAPFTPISSPFRKVLSPRNPSLSSRPNSRRVSEDLMQELAKGMQLSIVKDPSTSKPSSDSPIIDDTNQERSATATLKRKIPSPNRPTPDSQPTTPRFSPVRRVPSIAGPKSRPSSPHRSISGSYNGSRPSGEDPFEESARQLEAVIVDRPLPSSQPKTNAPSLLPAVVASPAEHDASVARSESERFTRSNPIVVTDERKPDESNREDLISSPSKTKLRCRKREVVDDEEAEEQAFETNVAKRSKRNLPIFDRKVTLQDDVYDLEPLFESIDALYFFDDVNNTWLAHKDESNDVDDLQTWGNDDKSTYKSALPLASEWEERKLPISTAVAPLKMGTSWSINARCYLMSIFRRSILQCLQKATSARSSW
ncbi:hypothetical protein FS842_002293 [Serendipita sp. 407]|nr:hypothetical protein FS842_002293 [Serendipita sp. 407]